jgi:Ser/Thr protein kinase RdoA (MazF antagonist)
MYANQQSLSPEPDLIAAAEVYFPDAERVTMIAGFPHQVLVVRGDGQWAVRRWAPPATITAVEWTADAMDAARAAGVTLVPAHLPVPGRGAQRALLLGGQVYDAISWPDGRPLNRYGTFTLETGGTINLPLPDSMAAPEVLTDAMRELAKIHLATQQIADRADASVLTLESMLTAAEAQYVQLRKTVGRHAGGNQEIRRWLRCGNRVLPAATERLTEASGIASARTCAVHGDLWPSRLLVDEVDGQLTLTGIVGWRQAAAGAPVLDIARIAARVARWSAATAETVVGAYSEVAPLAPEQRRLVPVIAALDLTSITGTMLQAAYDDDTIANDPVQSFIRSGIQTSLRSLETLANVLVPEERAVTRRSFHARPSAAKETREVRPRRSPQPRNRRG